MVSKEEKYLIVKILGKHYVGPILNYLKEKGFKTKYRNDYSADYIRMIVCGQTENLEIEKAILRVCELQKKKEAQHDSRKQETLNQLAS